MTTATSYTARMDAARAALAGYDEAAKAGTPHFRHASRIAAALRALIEPPATDENAEAVAVRVALDYSKREPFRAARLAEVSSSVKQIATAAVHAGIQAAWESWEPDDYAPAPEPEFAPDGEEDEFRDLWNANTPRVSGCMYFAIPGEPPIHLDDEQARHILAYLSEQKR
ncbi:hypothetical protein [Agromyces larvae]|uniref:Uncharacterized protein n=1 Tax=Agromyces larvae TaxID=2929802 RepID=A0ABY4CB68_9MICO|nr:hypothetical protein [Agromyces larvae]UOE45940.1 hypothetical protein MTO99_09425 [Agromyces larvae]